MITSLGHRSNAAVLSFSNFDNLDDSSVGESFPPNSIVPGTFESNDEIFFFQEQESLTLSSDLDVNLSSPGTFDGNGVSTGTISSGTVVNSFLFSFDPIDGSQLSEVAEIEFSTPILGVIHAEGLLSTSDVVLGGAGITLPTGVSGRAVEGSNGDTITVVDDFNLSAQVFAGGVFVDQFRVITEADVPFEFSPSLGLLMVFLTIIAKKTFKTLKLR